MKTEEISKKTNYSVPILAGLWQSNIARLCGGVEKPLMPKEFGQLKQLRKYLEDITWDVIEWVLESNNWWRFSQKAKTCAGLPCAPAKPHIGFLLAHYEVAVDLMYSIAKSTNTVGAAEFVKKVDRQTYEILKKDLKEVCQGNPEHLAMVEAAKTQEELCKLYAQMTK